MTREEAIEILKSIKEEYDCPYDIEALDMAIQALQTEPSEDIKDALHIAQTDRDKWKARAEKLAKIIGIRDCDIDQYKQEHCVDAISRAEAMNVLDALYLDGESAQGFTADANGDCLIGKYKAIEILEELPSVQPQKVVRCKDCKYVWKEDGWDNLYCNRVKVSGSFAVERDGFCAWGEMEEGE